MSYHVIFVSRQFLESRKYGSLDIEERISDLENNSIKQLNN